MRLRIRDLEMRDRVIVALVEAIQKDNSYARIVVLEADDGIDLLVRYARFQEEEEEVMSVIIERRRKHKVSRLEYWRLGLRWGDCGRHNHLGNSQEFG